MKLVFLKERNGFGRFYFFPYRPRTAKNTMVRFHSVPENHPVFGLWYGAVRKTKKTEPCTALHLAAMAKDLLNIPATSAATDRAFSVGKDVYGISRYKLWPKTVEALVCLRS